MMTWSATRLERVARSACTASVPRSRMRAMTSRGSRDPATSSAIWMSSPRSWFGSGANIQPETLPQVKPSAGGEGEEWIRLARLGVLLEALDDQGPGVVDRAQVVLRDGRRPVRVTEEHTGLPVFGGGDVPGHGRPIPIGEVRERRPLDAFSRLQLIDSHALRRPAKTEGRDRPDLRLGLAFPGPEGGEPFRCGGRLIGLLGSRLDVHLVHQRSGHVSILLKERLNLEVA